MKRERGADGPQATVGESCCYLWGAHAKCRFVFRGSDGQSESSRLITWWAAFGPGLRVQVLLLPFSYLG